MPRIKVVLNKTNTLKLNKFFKWAKKEWKNIDNEYLSEVLIKEIKNEIKNLKEYCSEKSIVESWIGQLESLPVPEELTRELILAVRTKVRTELANIYTNKTFDNNIDIYFNEVKKEYILHPQNEQNEIQFLPENRDIFIKNNLRTVIACAKKYQGKGLPFEDLIQAGNEGLLIAFDKFKTDKANLRNAIIAEIEESDKESYSYNEAEEIIKKHFTYGKLLDVTLSKIPDNGFENKNDFIQWCKENVKSAVFASVAFKWIRSNIILELIKLGSIIKLPKSSKKKDNLDIELGDFILEIDQQESEFGRIIRLDSINPYTDDNYSDADLAMISSEEFVVENEVLENFERQESFKSIVENILSNLGQQERMIVKKKYGIGYPYQMTINEIAESEKLSINNVKKILRDSILILQENLSGDQKDYLLEIL